MKIFSLLLKIIFGLVIGALVSIYLLQYEDQLKDMMSKNIKLFMKEFLNSEIEYDIKKINIFFPFVKIENVQVRPMKNPTDWYWHCKRISVSLSWIDILFFKRIQPKVVINNLEAYSQVKDNNLLIGPHFQKLLFSGNDSAIPVIINDLKLNKSNFIAEDKKLNFKFQIRYDCQTTEIDKILQNKIYINGGSFEYKNIQYFHNISGLFHLGVLYNGEIKNFSVDGLIELSNLDINKNKCFFVSKWQNEANDCLIRLSTIDGKSIINFLMTGIKETQLKMNLSVCSPISTFQKALQMNYNLESDFELNANLDINNLKNINGTCKFNNLHFVGNQSENQSDLVNLDEIKFNFKSDSKKINSHVLINKKDKLKLLGEIAFDLESKECTLAFNNEPSNLQKNKFFLSLAFNKDFEFTGKFDSDLFSDFLNRQIKSNCNIKGSQNFIDVKGNVDDEKFDLNAVIRPNFKINKFSLTDDKKNECFNIISDIKSANSIKGFLNCNDIKNWLSKYFFCLLDTADKQIFIGNGKLEFEGDCTLDGFKGNIIMRNANLVIPEIHNILNNISGKMDFNIKEKKLTLEDLMISFYKGQIKCKKLVIIFDDFTSRVIKFIHCPLVIKNCFINWENLFLTNISGRLILQKILDKNLSLTGNVSLDQSQIKDNIFSPEFRKSIFKSANLSRQKDTEIEEPQKLKVSESKFVDDIDIDISIFTKSSIKLKTTFFKSLINLDFKLIKLGLNFNILGDINLADGVIIFPYKDLQITNANIKFLPNQISDPLINIIAKNKIKGYSITLQVMGSAQNPHVLLESSPTLTEEQIISLLLIGSESSLNLVIPALLVQNIKNIVLGSAKYQEKLKKHFAQILTPFKRIRIIPAFHDTLGGKGLTATLDIDVNDRLNATIQNNFTTYEEPRVEVDYLLSDDVVVRGVKDEIGNLSGEIELRWKF